MNWLFLTFAVSALAGAVYTYSKTRRRAGRTRQGPVPGYTATDGREFALDPLPELERGVDWWPELIEEFHSPDRARLVLRFGLRESVDTESTRALLTAAVKQVSQRSHAHVVYAEAHTEGRLRGVYLWAPDGRGWSGREPKTEIWFGGVPA